MQVYETVQLPSDAKRLSVKRGEKKVNTRGRIAYLDCKKSTILCRMSVSLTPSRESSKPGVSTNITE